ncbi:MAG: hypothetical protein ACTSU2_16280 [Promethearchaeota archaeon]
MPIRTLFLSISNIFTYRRFSFLHLDWYRINIDILIILFILVIIIKIWSYIHRWGKTLITDEQGFKISKTKLELLLNLLKNTNLPPEVPLNLKYVEYQSATKESSNLNPLMTNSRNILLITPTFMSDARILSLSTALALEDKDNPANKLRVYYISLYSLIKYTLKIRKYLERRFKWANLLNNYDLLDLLTMELLESLNISKFIGFDYAYIAYASLCLAKLKPPKSLDIAPNPNHETNYQDEVLYYNASISIRLPSTSLKSVFNLTNLTKIIFARPINIPEFKENRKRHNFLIAFGDLIKNKKNPIGYRGLWLLYFHISLKIVLLKKLFKKRKECIIISISNNNQTHEQTIEHDTSSLETNVNNTISLRLPDKLELKLILPQKNLFTLKDFKFTPQLDSKGNKINETNEIKKNTSEHGAIKERLIIIRSCKFSFKNYETILLSEILN